MLCLHPLRLGDLLQTCTDEAEFVTRSIRGKTLADVQDTQGGFQACLSLLKYASPSAWLLVAKSPGQKQGHIPTAPRICAAQYLSSQRLLCVLVKQCSQTDQQTHGCPRGELFCACMEHIPNPKLLTRCCIPFICCIQRGCTDTSLHLHSQDTVPLLVHYSTGTAVSLCRTVILHLLVVLLSYPT